MEVMAVVGLEEDMVVATVEVRVAVDMAAMGE